MSILKSLQTYLEGFEGMELQPIMTDGVDSSVSYALQPSGNRKTITDILGNRTYVNNYVFYAKAYTGSEADRQDNYEWLDEFFEWIEGNDEKEIYPDIKGYTVEGISATNVLLFDVDENGKGTYQIQIQLELRKGR